MATRMRSFYTAPTSAHGSTHSQPIVDELISKYNSSISTSTRSCSMSFSKRRRNILQRCLDRLFLEYYRYEVTFGVYVMTPGEKFVANAFVFVALTLLIWAVLLYFPQHLFRNIGRFVWILTGHSEDVAALFAPPRAVASISKAPLAMGNDTLAPKPGVKSINRDLLEFKVSDQSERRSSWTNVITVKELPWLDDHKLGSTTVFPAAGYLTLAAETLLQLHRARETTFLGVTLRQVDICRILVIQEENDDASIVTELRPARSSSVEEWWSFKICSFVGSNTTIHATGQIAGLSEISVPNPTFDKFSIASMEDQPRQAWYDKLAEEGLRLGRQFQSLARIYNDGAQGLCRTISETRLFSRNDGVGQSRHSNSLLHPITLETLLQTALIASAGGVISNFEAKVPVAVETVEIMLPPPATFSSSCRMYADSRSIGLGVFSIDAELRSLSRLVLIKMSNIRCVPAFE
ncbi:hypothetical protein UA08_06954 [Talaromyces atroroseus]|uniref:PKS/mFAS DH domain-containing protein n=1 Tax=Talaromyces atroroseus TaxID=1441469 RepID=A0A225A9W7_TALAT|nr:hypothetical protein UA08_06954 [Talaromyces atroroseus]OKL57592.1 hypothetical protein UA08_06954 [Talaromyces atroroseus]